MILELVGRNLPPGDWNTTSDEREARRIERLGVVLWVRNYILHAPAPRPPPTYYYPAWVFAIRQRFTEVDAFEHVVRALTSDDERMAAWHASRRLGGDVAANAYLDGLL